MELYQNSYIICKCSEDDEIWIFIKGEKTFYIFNHSWYEIPPHQLGIKDKIYCIQNSYHKCLEGKGQKVISNSSPSYSAIYLMKCRFFYLKVWKTGCTRSTVKGFGKDDLLAIAVTSHNFNNFLSYTACQWNGNCCNLQNSIAQCLNSTFGKIHT